MYESVRWSVIETSNSVAQCCASVLLGQFGVFFHS